VDTDVLPQGDPPQPEAFALDMKVAAGSTRTDTVKSRIPEATPSAPPAVETSPAATDAPAGKRIPNRIPHPERRQDAIEPPSHTKTAGQEDHAGKDRREEGDRPAGQPGIFAKQPPAVRVEAPRVDGPAIPARPVTDAAPAFKSEPIDSRPARAPDPPATTAAPIPETNEEIKPAPRSAQEIALRLGSSADSRVDVRITDRGGEVHVSVRTPDGVLAREMRQDLGSLTGRLAQAGFETAAPSNGGFSSRHDEGRREFAGGESDGSPFSGSGRQQQQGERQQQDDSRGRRFTPFDSFSQYLSERNPTERMTHDDATR
jgi:hypothetical protein